MTISHRAILCRPRINDRAVSLPRTGDPEWPSQLPESPAPQPSALRPPRRRQWPCTPGSSQHVGMNLALRERNVYVLAF